jgi:hypothetical protein
MTEGERTRGREERKTREREKVAGSVENEPALETGKG